MSIDHMFCKVGSCLKFMSEAFCSLQSQKTSKHRASTVLTPSLDDAALTDTSPHSTLTERDVRALKMTKGKKFSDIFTGIIKVGPEFWSRMRGDGLEMEFSLGRPLIWSLFAEGFMISRKEK